MLTLEAPVLHTDSMIFQPKILKLINPVLKRLIVGLLQLDSPKTRDNSNGFTIVWGNSGEKSQSYITFAKTFTTVYAAYTQKMMNSTGGAPAYSGIVLSKSQIYIKEANDVTTDTFYFLVIGVS